MNVACQGSSRCQWLELIQSRFWIWIWLLSEKMVTVMLVTSWRWCVNNGDWKLVKIYGFWWLNFSVADIFLMLVPDYCEKIWCWWLKWPKSSPTSYSLWIPNIRHQHRYGRKMYMSSREKQLLRKLLNPIHKPCRSVIFAWYFQTSFS